MIDNNMANQLLTNRNFDANGDSWVFGNEWHWADGEMVCDAAAADLAEGTLYQNFLDGFSFGATPPDTTADCQVRFHLSFTSGLIGFYLQGGVFEISSINIASDSYNFYTDGEDSWVVFNGVGASGNEYDVLMVIHMTDGSFDNIKFDRYQGADFLPTMDTPFFGSIDDVSVRRYFGGTLPAYSPALLSAIGRVEQGQKDPTFIIGGQQQD